MIDNHNFQIQGVVFGPEKVTSIALFGAIIYAVYRYILEQQARRAALEQEMQSAREIQQVLIPEALPSLEGYSITSAYTPAQEVGGDFFQILANPDGSTIVALGDVSGKGLKAAMNVSMIVGVMRAQAAATSSPQEIIRRTEPLPDGPNARWIRHGHCLSPGSGRNGYVCQRRPSATLP